MMNKRRFLQGAAGACAAPAALAQRAAMDTSTAAPTLATLLERRPSARDWQQFLNETFEVTDGPTRHALTLQAVQVLEVPECRVETEQFTLVFAQSGEGSLASGTHVLTHAVGEQVPLFLHSTTDSLQPTLRAEFSLLR
jgi:hypothetical protein